MKALKCFAVSAALLALGACSAVPAQEKTDFMRAVAGQIAVITNSGSTNTSDYAVFSTEGGQRFDLPTISLFANFVKAETGLTAYYDTFQPDHKPVVTGAGRSYKVVVNADKKGITLYPVQGNGSYPANGTAYDFKIKK